MPLGRVFWANARRGAARPTWRVTGLAGLRLVMGFSRIPGGLGVGGRNAVRGIPARGGVVRVSVLGFGIGGVPNEYWVYLVCLGLLGVYWVWTQ